MRTKSQVQLQKWESIITEFNKSELGTSEFCRVQGLPKQSFYYWKKRVASAVLQRPPKIKSPFLPVTIEQAQALTDKSKRVLPDAKWAAEFAAHFIKSLS
jgi:hypothetical protein